MVGNYLKAVVRGSQGAWDWLPKEGKVAVYILGAVIIEGIAKSLSPDFLSFIPVQYRLGLYNLLEVLLVETAKRLRR